MSATHFILDPSSALLGPVQRRASRWKPIDEDFGIDDLNAIAGELNRLPNQCIWHVAQEYGDKGADGFPTKGYRVTAIDAVPPRVPGEANPLDWPTI